MSKRPLENERRGEAAPRPYKGEKTMSRKTYFNLLVLVSIFLSVLFLCGCGPFDALANTILAILAGLPIVLKALVTVLTPAQEAEAQEADTLAISAVTDLKNTVDAYEADKTGTGLLAAVQAAIAAVQQTLQGWVTLASQFGNAAFQKWVGVVVGLLQAVLTLVSTDILPNVQDAVTAAAGGNKAKLESLGEKLKVMAAKLRADHDAALDASGLPADVIANVRKSVDNKLKHHIGPIPF
jgi:hypothetical protein